MRSRCFNKNFPRYPDYGGRGISICDEWNDFPIFLNWAEKSRYNESATIDRIDNNRGYSADNCRWVPAKQQGRNKRNNRRVTIFGETKTMVEWTEDTRCASPQNFRMRIHLGWDEKRALLEPGKIIAKRRNNLVTYRGKTRTVFAWCKILGFKPAAIYARFNRGLDAAEIFAPIRQVEL